LPFKSVEVVGYKDFLKVYDPLPEESFLKRRIKEVRDEMKNDINRGDFIKRKPYPDKLDVQNLYVYDIGNTHRLIYTIRATRGEKKMYQYLDLFSHKEYDVMFGYSTS